MGLLSAIKFLNNNDKLHNEILDEIIKVIKDYGYKCAYRLTNYSDAYTYYKLTTNSF